jgi:flagellin
MFKINTNIAAMNANLALKTTGLSISKSLGRLSSGLRVNVSADDPAGMLIADALRNRSKSLGQAIKNANDTIGLTKIVDSALEEQIKLMDLIKSKAIQAAQSSQSNQTREALQSDVASLLKELDNISFSTTYNGQKLLAGTFVNKEFQIGADSHETIKASIKSTDSSKIGHTRFETSMHIGWSTTTGQKFTQHANPLRLSFLVDGRQVDIGTATLSTSAGTGIGDIAKNINKNSDILGGIRASWTNTMTFGGSVISGSITGLVINNINIGNIADIKSGDKEGSLVFSINKVTASTGVTASLDAGGKLSLRSLDGRGISMTANSGSGVLNGNRATVGNVIDYGSAGRITLRHDSATDISMTATGFGGNNQLENLGFNGRTGLGGVGASEATVNLFDAMYGFTANQADAFGLFSNAHERTLGAERGVLNVRSAMMIMDVVDSALIDVEQVRSDIGSVQKRLNVVVNNLSSGQVNIIASESQIRDVNFSIETSRFSKSNILLQAGNYALTQANQLSSLVMQLLKN